MTHPIFGGARVVNLRADNDPAHPALQMNLTADYAVLVNPVSGDLVTIAEGLSTHCFIHVQSECGRDQAAPFVGGDVARIFYIWGAEVGIAATCSKRSVKQGPVLPPGYTHFAFAFPVPLVTVATFLPTLPQGGSTALRVRGGEAFWINSPHLVVPDGGGAFASLTDMSPWVPRPDALLADIEINPEFQCSNGPSKYGFIVGVDPWNNIKNYSMYANVPNEPCAQNDSFHLPINDAGHIYTRWDYISGNSATSFVAVIFICGYTFSNG